MRYLVEGKFKIDSKKFSSLDISSKVAEIMSQLPDTKMLRRDHMVPNIPGLHVVTYMFEATSDNGNIKISIRHDPEADLFHSNFQIYVYGGSELTVYNALIKTLGLEGIEFKI